MKKYRLINLLSNEYHPYFNKKPNLGFRFYRINKFSSIETLKEEMNKIKTLDFDNEFVKEETRKSLIIK